MKNSRRLLLIIAFQFLVLQTSMAGGPWAKGKGKGYAQLGTSFLMYNRIFDNDGKAVETVGKYADITLQAYSEIGIAEKLTLKAVLPLVMTSSNYDAPSLLENSSLTGLGNIQLGGGTIR